MYGAPHGNDQRRDQGQGYGNGHNDNSGGSNGYPNDFRPPQGQGYGNGHNDNSGGSNGYPNDFRPPQGQGYPSNPPPPQQQIPPYQQHEGRPNRMNPPPQQQFNAKPGYQGLANPSQAPNRGKQFEWVSCKDNRIPPNAVQGGVEADGKPLFVARAFYKAGLHPGKAGQHLSDGGFAMSYDGKEIRLNEYYVLCGDAGRLRWIQQNGALNAVDAKLVEAGHEEDGRLLYVAKTRYKGSQQIGKCAEHLKRGMSFPYGKKEKSAEDYLVLAYV